ncbi:MAG: methyltransferase domain-containing protein [Caldilineales bacterium]|nr:methyltransferase domain-containing protein [Caldilineales bacterium]
MNGERRKTLFHALYHQLAWAYDAVSWLVSLGAWDAWRRLALDEVRGERVLELGSGTGALLVAAAQIGLNPIGLDRSAAMARQARRRLQRQGLPTRLVQGDWRALPFGEAAFDTVIATFPAEVILEAEAWQELARVLAPGGRFVAVLTAHSTDPLLRALDGLLDRLVPPDAEMIAKWQRLPERVAAAGWTVRIEQRQARRALVSVWIATRPEAEER